MTNPPPLPSAHRARWTIPLAVSGAAALIIGISLFGFLASDDAPAAGAELRLAMPGSTGTSMGSCIPFSVSELARMPVAFAGTATAINAGTVDLSVEHWFSGGDAAHVLLDAPDDPSDALLGGEIQFDVGGEYLITATNGTVNLCGFSGPATPQLQSAFEEAYLE